jgi:hypothetical protein
MFGLRQLACLAAVACLIVAVGAAARAGDTAPAGFIEVKLGLNNMSKTDRANLWKLVDEYATVDALQEFCGTNLNLQRRAWRAVGSCVEAASLKRVFSAFRTKKAEYLKAWETLHGEPEKKKLVCERFKGKLGQYAKVMSGQIAEAANMCRNCFFC